MKKHVFLAVLLCGLSGSLWAQGSEQSVRCVESEAAQGVHPAMMACEDEALARHDQRMNAAYRHLMGKLPAAKRQALRREQRAWLRERDQQAQKVLAEGGGGQAGELNRIGLLNSMTAQRAEELEQRLQALR